MIPCKNTIFEINQDDLYTDMMIYVKEYFPYEENFNIDDKSQFNDCIYRALNTFDTQTDPNQPLHTQLMINAMKHNLLTLLKYLFNLGFNINTKICDYLYQYDNFKDRMAISHIMMTASLHMKNIKNLIEILLMIRINHVVSVLYNDISLIYSSIDRKPMIDIVEKILSPEFCNEYTQYTMELINIVTQCDDVNIMNQFLLLPNILLRKKHYIRMLYWSAIAHNKLRILQSLQYEHDVTQEHQLIHSITGAIMRQHLYVIMRLLSTNHLNKHIFYLIFERIVQNLNAVSIYYTISLSDIRISCHKCIDLLEETQNDYLLDSLSLFAQIYLERIDDVKRLLKDKKIRRLKLKSMINFAKESNNKDIINIFINMYKNTINEQIAYVVKKSNNDKIMKDLNYKKEIIDKIMMIKP